MTATDYDDLDSSRAHRGVRFVDVQTPNTLPNHYKQVLSAIVNSSHIKQKVPIHEYTLPLPSKPVHPRKMKYVSLSRDGIYSCHGYGEFDENSPASARLAHKSHFFLKGKAASASPRRGEHVLQKGSSYTRAHTVNSYLTPTLYGNKQAYPVKTSSDPNLAGNNQDKLYQSITQR